MAHNYNYISELQIMSHNTQYFTNVTVKMTHLYLKMNTWLRMTLFLANASLNLTTVTSNPTNTTTPHKCDLSVMNTNLIILEM